MGAGGVEELGDGGAHRQPVRVARVDPAEQRFHQAVDDLAAETGRHVLPDGHVVADLRGRQVGVAFDAGEALRGEEPGQRGGGAGDAHDVALGHGAQGVAGPDRRGGGGGRCQAAAEADLAGEGDRLGAAGQYRLGAEVDPDAGDLAGQQLAADPARGLQDRHPRAAVQQPVRGGQSGDPAPDDDDMPGLRTGLLCAHASTLSDPTDNPARPLAPGAVPRGEGAGRPSATVPTGPATRGRPALLPRPGVRAEAGP